MRVSPESICSKLYLKRFQENFFNTYYAFVHKDECSVIAVHTSNPIESFIRVFQDSNVTCILYVAYGFGSKFSKYLANQDASLLKSP